MLESHNYFHDSIIFVLTRGVARIIIVCSPNLHLPPFGSSYNVYYLPSISFKFIKFTGTKKSISFFQRNEVQLINVLYNIHEMRVIYIYIYITKSNIFFIPSHLLPHELICFVSLNIFILNNNSYILLLFLLPVIYRRVNYSEAYNGIFNMISLMLSMLFYTNLHIHLRRDYNNQNYLWTEYICINLQA